MALVQGRHSGSTWAVTAIRRALATIRHMHQEAELMSEAMFRPVGAPRPSPRTSTTGGNGIAAAEAGDAPAVTGGKRPAA